MAVYRPTYTDKKTGETKQSRVWWYEFIYGNRIRESAKTKRKTVAVEAEKRRLAELERARAGIPAEKPGNRIRSVSDVMRAYVASYGVNHRPTSEAFVKSCAKHVERLLGTTLLSDLTEERIREYMTVRSREKASGRAVNAELGELTRAIGRPWKALWPRVRKMEERKDVGKALSAEEERRLLEAADRNRSPNVRTMFRISLLTGLRAGELAELTWDQVDLHSRVVTVGKAKSEAGTGRQVPMNENLVHVFAAHADWFKKRFGKARPDHYVFPWGSPYPSDPTRPCAELKTAWETIRTQAKVKCRWHDLRHTVCTKMAEAGVPESTMLAIMGHMSRAMLERYSHVRMKAKRAAVESLTLPDFSPKSDGVLQEVPKVSKKATLRQPVIN